MTAPAPTAVKRMTATPARTALRNLVTLLVCLIDSPAPKKTLQVDRHKAVSVKPNCKRDEYSQPEFRIDGPVHCRSGRDGRIGAMPAPAPGVHLKNGLKAPGAWEPECF